MSDLFPSYRLYSGKLRGSWPHPSGEGQAPTFSSSGDRPRSSAPWDRLWEEVSWSSDSLDKKATQECPCGYLGDPRHPCRCRPHEIQRYWRKLSGPFLDRIDLFVRVPRLSRDELLGEGGGEPSEAVRARVAAARELQRERFGGPRTNAEMGLREVKEHCPLSPEAKGLLARAIDHYGLSARAYARILKVSRIIADLEGTDIIRPEHVAEALQYRPQKEGET